jgi:hypothetical protein
LLLAHRLSYAIHNGEIKSGLNVLHSCDNPSCVNPSHLRCGTASDNQQDAYSRKRRVSPFSKKENRYQGQRTGHPGAANPNAKLTEDDVRAIRSSFDEPRKLAEQYNILPEYVNRIRNRMAWKHVE